MDRDFRKEWDEGLNGLVFEQRDTDWDDVSVREEWMQEVLGTIDSQCDEIDNLRKEVKTWKEVAQNRDPYIKSLNDEIDRLRAQIHEIETELEAQYLNIKKR